MLNLVLPLKRYHIYVGIFMYIFFFYFRKGDFRNTRSHGNTCNIRGIPFFIFSYIPRPTRIIFVYISIMLDKVEVHKITKRKKLMIFFLDFKINTCSVFGFRDEAIKFNKWEYWVIGHSKKFLYIHQPCGLHNFALAFLLK